MKYRKRIILLAVGISLTLGMSAQAKTLDSRVNEAFRSVFSRNPTGAENIYWLGRVVRKEKNTYEALRGAMYFHKAQGNSMGSGKPTASSSTGTSTATVTNKSQLIKDTLLIFIDIYGKDPSNSEKAWWRKRISCNEIKSETALRNSMRYHKGKNVRKGRDTICGAKASSSSSGVTNRGVAGISSHPMGDQVRIGIYNTNGSAISVTGNGKYQIREGQKKILATLGKEDVVKVSWSDGKYHVRGSGISLDTSGVIRLVPLNQAVMQVKSYLDKSSTIAGKNYNRFRGIIEIRKCDGCGELWAINELRTEYYLRGLAETSGNGPEQYIKALGIAARTYVLYHMSVTGGRKPAQGYDIGKTSDDQIYRGYEYEIITPRMASIFNKVKGIIVTDSEGDTPVSTIYFSDSDGKTRSAKDKWNTSRFPHLQQSVADPHHVSSTCRGHCVGMSAQGAYGFANKDGWSYQKILKYFYKGVKLVKAY
jgi:hypothetical protein